MKRFTTIIFFVVAAVLLTFLSGCSGDKTSYSFFVAGHVYGTPSGNSVHIHPPFKEAFPYIRSTPGMAFGVFTGDMVRKSQKESFDTLVSELAELGMPYFVAPGNHDVSDRKLYESYFGDKKHGNRTYSTFTYRKDLFILLDANLNRWSIKSKQLEFLRKTLKEFAPKSRNIFVFVHQLIFWDEDNEFRNVHLNWPPYTPDTTNYWSDVEPLLASTGKPVYLFAGDLGANHIATPFMYYKKGNITYVASGMGHKKKDNFVIVHVGNEGEINLELVALQGDPDSMGDVENYLPEKLN